jgi:hypothetical protein
MRARLERVSRQLDGLPRPPTRQRPRRYGRRGWNSAGCGRNDLPFFPSINDEDWLLLVATTDLEMDRLPLRVASPTHRSTVPTPSSLPKRVDGTPWCRSGRSVARSHCFHTILRGHLRLQRDRTPTTDVIVKASSTAATCPVTTAMSMNTPTRHGEISRAGCLTRACGWLPLSSSAIRVDQRGGERERSGAVCPFLRTHAERGVPEFENHGQSITVGPVGHSPDYRNVSNTKSIFNSHGIDG